jgi:hypothetical protein
VDAELARRYRPGEPRNGLLVHVIERLNELRTTARKLPAAPALTAKPERVMFPARIWKDVDRRWQELGYPSLSAYVTGLARYDLLLGGPHRTVSETANRAKQDAHARKSIVRYRRGEPRKLNIDHLIERTEGRTLSRSELEQSKAKIAQHLKGLSVSLEAAANSQNRIAPARSKPFPEPTPRAIAANERSGIPAHREASPDSLEAEHAQQITGGRNATRNVTADCWRIA